VISIAICLRSRLNGFLLKADKTVEMVHHFPKASADHRAKRMCENSNEIAVGANAEGVTQFQARPG